MNKKIIIHLIQSLDAGGCENMLLRTLPLVADFEHIIITLKKPGELAEKFKQKNIKVICIKQHNILDLSSYFRLSGEIKKYNPGLIVTYLFHADIIGKFLFGTFTSHKAVPFLRTTYNHKKYRIARLLMKLTKFLTNKYLANSQSVKKYYIEKIGINESKITVIPNGIDVDFYENVPRDGKLRQSLGIKPEEIVIICVANLHINKGHKYLLEAFEGIHQRNDKVKLLLVGNGDEKENLLKQMDGYTSRNSILFLGTRADVPQLLKISDIFVLPTMFEGMSNAIQEAMTAKLAIITTDIQENRELIKNNKTGILVPVKSSDKISESINNLIKNPGLRLFLGENTRKDALNRFDLTAISQQLSTFLKRVSA